jgi:hypothetical protein
VRSLLLLLALLALSFSAFLGFVGLELLAESLKDFLVLNTLGDLHFEHVLGFFLETVAEGVQT